MVKGRGECSPRREEKWAVLCQALEPNYFSECPIWIAEKYAATFFLGFFGTFVKSHSSPEDLTPRESSLLLYFLHVSRKIWRHANIKPHWAINYSHCPERVWCGVGEQPLGTGLPRSTEQRASFI